MNYYVNYVKVNFYDENNNLVTSHNLSTDRLKSSPIIIIPSNDRASKFYKQINKNKRKYDYIEFTPIYF